MEKLYLQHPSIEHKEQYEEMMTEWEIFGGRLNPRALGRYSQAQQRNIEYEKWLKWMDEDRESCQDLFFLMQGNKILGAISLRYKCAGIHGHVAYGIRPSERKKGYASKMLELALPVVKGYGHNPIIISCAKENVASAKVIINNRGILVEEVANEDSGEITQIYHICASELRRGETN